MQEQDKLVPYLAGFFDGEGCVTVGNNGSPTLRVINTSKPVLDMFTETFGGKVLERKQKVNKKQYHWSVYGDEAFNVATKLVHFSVEKKPQLRRIIDWAFERGTFKTQTLDGRRGRFANPRRDEAIKQIQKELTGMKSE